MYSVTLSACGNPDHKENPYNNVVNGIAVEKDIAVADSIEECQRLVRNYIEDNCLGAGNWTGGRVFENGVRVGYISYNGRYWEKEHHQLNLVRKKKNISNFKLVLEQFRLKQSQEHESYYYVRMPYQ